MTDQAHAEHLRARESTERAAAKRASSAAARRVHQELATRYAARVRGADESNSRDEYYLLARAEEEIEKAQCSRDPKAVSSHFRLAELYLEAVYGTDEADPERARS